MTRETRVCGLVLAGGKARRFGQDKRFALLNGTPLINHAITALCGQVDEVALSCNDTIPGFDHLVHLADQRAQEGPLLGIAEGLAYALDEGFDWLVTVPADSPFFPADLCERLVGSDLQIRFAESSGRIHPVFGAWPTMLTPALFAEIAKGERKIDRAAAAIAPVHTFEWATTDGDPFFNVNRTEDLKAAEARI